MTTIQEGRWLIGSLVLLAATAANAQDFDLLGISMDSTHQFTLGANMRMQDRDHSIIGKTNIPGQQGLCEADDCVSSSGDPAPNQRFVDAPGFNDSDGDKVDQQHILGITKVLKEEVEEVHAFAFVFNSQNPRFDKSMQDMVELLHGMFGLLLHFSDADSPTSSERFARVRATFVLFVPARLPSMPPSDSGLDHCPRRSCEALAGKSSSATMW